LFRDKISGNHGISSEQFYFSTLGIRMLKSTPNFSYFSQTVVKFGARWVFVPGGELKPGCCGERLQPEERSGASPMSLKNGLIGRPVF